MRAICEGGVDLSAADSVSEVWWVNVVLMGVQVGNEFGEKFADAAGLAEGVGWRLRLVAALVQRRLPAAWLSVAVEAARGVEAAVAKLVAAELAKEDALVVGKRVLAMHSNGISWLSGQVTRGGPWARSRGKTPRAEVV